MPTSHDIMTGSTADERATPDVRQARFAVELGPAVQGLFAGEPLTPGGAGLLYCVAAN
jgi:hypothetical protein